jgi:hypothetical protein
MGKRHPNHRRVKMHRNYTLEEIASSLGCHKNTVLAWVKCGLPTIDGKRPKLVLGQELIAFLQVRRARNKRPCQPEQMYCFRCRTPKCPEAEMVEYLPITDKVGNLRAPCPDCGSIMHRCVSMAKIGLICEKMGITFPQALRRLSESNQLTVNSDLRGEVQR